MEISKGTKHFLRGMGIAVASGALVAIVDAKSQAGGLSDIDLKHVGNLAVVGGAIGLAGFIKNQKLEEDGEAEPETVSQQQQEAEAGSGGELHE